jgi:hypothetical protein
MEGEAMEPPKDSRRNHQIEAERTVFTFAYLSAAGDHALSDGKATPEGSLFEWMAAAVFSAFSLEAYLNHLGPERFRCWDDLERLSVDAKFSLILESLGKRADFSCRPFQTIKTLFRLRNQLAHGKTERAAEETIQALAPGERPRYPATKWETLCTEANAERFREDTKAVIRQIDEWTGCANPFLFSLGEGSSTTSAPIEEART